MNADKPIRLLIADDHELVRDGIRSRLEDQPGLIILGEAATGQEAVRLAREMEPDVIMMDVSMPALNGLEATKAIRMEGISSRILILSIFDSPEYVRGAIEAGANGYILKDVSSQEMLRAILTVGGGGLYLPTQVAGSLNHQAEKSNGSNASAAADQYGLTAREMDVLRAGAAGQPNKIIAHELGISVRTVESHRHNLREKLGGGNAAHLARIAVKLGLG